MKSTKEIKDAVTSGLRTVTDDATFSIEDGRLFSDAGLDSMDRMSLILEVETALGLDFGETNPDKLRSVADYVRYIQETWP